MFFDIVNILERRNSISVITSVWSKTRKKILHLWQNSIITLVGNFTTLVRIITLEGYFVTLVGVITSKLFHYTCGSDSIEAIQWYRCNRWLQPLILRAQQKVKPLKLRGHSFPIDTIWLTFKRVEASFTSTLTVLSYWGSMMPFFFKECYRVIERYLFTLRQLRLTC